MNAALDSLERSDEVLFVGGGWIDAFEDVRTDVADGLTVVLVAGEPEGVVCHQPSQGADLEMGHTSCDVMTDDGEDTCGSLPAPFK